MSLIRSIGLHLGLTVLGGVTALWVWTAEDEPLSDTAGEIRVYVGSPAKLESIRFESKSSKVTMEPKRDERGSFFVVRVDEEKAIPDPHAGPHGAKMNDQKSPNAKKKREKRAFISVEEGEKVAEGFAPLMALRAIGRIEKKRAEEFGFDDPEGMIFVKIGGQEHALEVGGTTPGGGDRYVRLKSSKEAYAVGGDLVRGMMHASSRLLERKLHGFEADTVTRVSISKAGHKREIVKLEGKVEGWADPATPTKQDETAGNWMAKLGRLRVSNYIEKGPSKVTPQDKVVEVEYFEKRNKVGFLSLVRSKSESGEPIYLARTEHSRWYVEVLKSAAEQLDQDLDSVLQKAQ